MPALFVFLLKVNLALLLFCAGYYLVLRHLTFYSLNRIYLVGAILFATVYPQINLSSFAQYSRLQPVQNAILNWQAPAKAMIKPHALPAYWQWITLAFWAGVIILSLRLLMQLYSLYKLYRNSTAAQLYNHDVRLINNDAGPFSFWKSIFVNPANHKPEDLKAILLHEQIHVNEWHTLDILLAEFSTIFYWFNPGVWLMKRAVRENIEFITDRKILTRGMDSKQYQYSLVSVSFAASTNTIVNNFNISTIKKRIIMMNAKKSSKFKLTSYAFLVPAVVALLLVFTISKAAIEKKSGTLHNLASVIKSSVRHIQTKPVKPTNLPTVINKLLPTDTVNKTVKPPVVYYIDTTKKTSKKSDTIRTMNIIGTGNSSSSDPLTYIVDGKPATSEELKTLQPGELLSLDIKKEDGKKLMYINTTKGIKSYPLSVKDYPLINGRYHVDVVDTLKGGNNIKMITINGVQDTIHFKKMAKVTQFKSTFKVDGFKNIAYASAFPRSASISNLSNKLIIIDGNTASEQDLKKLSAFDIDRMVFKDDYETENLYGDKAKNGIVFIITKAHAKKDKTPVMVRDIKIQ